MATNKVIPKQNHRYWQITFEENKERKMTTCSKVGGSVLIVDCPDLIDKLIDKHKHRMDQDTDRRLGGCIFQGPYSWKKSERQFDEDNIQKKKQYR